MPARILLGDESVARDIDSLGDRESLDVLVVDLTSDSDPRGWAFEGSSSLIAALREMAAEGGLEEHRHLIAATFPSIDDAERRVQRAATVGALRGIVQSVTREYAHRMKPLNLIAVARDDVDALAPTLDFLDAADGGYTAGFTFDLDKENQR